MCVCVGFPYFLLSYQWHYTICILGFLRFTPGDNFFIFTAYSLSSITSSVDINLIKLWEIVKDREAWHATVHRVTKSWTQLGK